MRGMRHGYGIRTSAPYGLASHSKPKTNANNSLRDAEESGAPGTGTNHGTGVSSGSAGDPASDRDKKMDDGRGGFVLKARSDDAPKERRRGSLIEKSTTVKRSLFQVYNEGNV
jgi:junctophilin